MNLILSIILKTHKQLDNVLHEQYITLYLDYINKFINTNLFKINNINVDKLIDNHELLYSKKIIFIDYDLIDSLMPDNYIYRLPPISFIIYMKRICKLPIYESIRSKINKKLISFKKKLNTPTNYKIIKHKKELTSIIDDVDDKYKILEPEFDPDGLAVLYINGSILQRDCLHDDLLEQYCLEYDQYKHESEKDLTKILEQVEILTWNDLNKYNISAARLYAYSYDIDELLITYRTENIKSICKKVQHKLHKKIYTFRFADELIIRVANKKY